MGKHYIGTDHDVEKMASSLSIANTMTFRKNKRSIHNMFKKDRKARDAYSLKIRRNEDTRSDYFTDPQDHGKK